jgi:uncharacterized membrane protein YfcA
MPMKILPKTALGKWSVGFNVLFVIAIAISVVLVKALGLLSFDDRWWDITALVFPASVIGAILGIVAVIKSKDRSLSITLSIFVGTCTFLFIIFHSLFISD